MRTAQKIYLPLLLVILGCSGLETKNKDAMAPAQPAPVLEKTRMPASNSWGGYHWARTTPQFTLKVGDNLTTADWKSLLVKTSGDWNSPTTFGATTTPINLSVVPGKSSKSRCNMVAGTTQVCNSRYGNNGWLGLASINIVGGIHITQGTAKMNDTYFNTAKYNNPNEKLHVMCQEVAHTFGLDHQSEDGSSQNSCMDYFSNTGANATSTLSTQPHAHDFEELNIVYGHLDSSTTVSSVLAANAASEVSEDPSSWGQLMSERSRGQHASYEKINKDGSKTITHVYWTQETAARCKDCDHRFDR